jgi:hypothetical protein
LVSGGEMAVGGTGWASEREIERRGQWWGRPAAVKRWEGADAMR